MGKLTMEDVFKALAKPLPEFELKPGRTALLLVDFQKLVGSEGLLSEALKAGLPEMGVKEALREFEQRVRKAVENAKRILEGVQEEGLRRSARQVGGADQQPEAYG